MDIVLEIYIAPFNFFYICAVLFADSSNSRLVGILLKDVLNKIAAILRTVTSNLDIE